MDRPMELPQFYNLVRLVAQIGAVVGCIGGVVAIIMSLSAFQFGLTAGLSGMFGGIAIIVLSLASLGITYCFLSIVQAQIDSRNAIVEYTSRK